MCDTFISLVTDCVIHHSDLKIADLITVVCIIKMIMRLIIKQALNILTIFSRVQSCVLCKQQSTNLSLSRPDNVKAKNISYGQLSDLGWWKPPNTPIWR